MICGIVLAAGRSRRMGRPKAFLLADGETFLARAVRALGDGGCAPVLVVTGPESDETAAAIGAEARRLGAMTVINPVPDSQQADSLRAALAALPGDASAAVVSPVDIPGLSPSVVREMARVFAATGAPVVLPSHGGRHGHPVLFASRLFPDLMAPDLPLGARSVIRAHQGELQEVPVDALPADVDTPEDYRRLAGGP